MLYYDKEKSNCNNRGITAGLIGLGAGALYLYDKDEPQTLYGVIIEKKSVKQINSHYEPFLDRTLSSTEAKALMDTVYMYGEVLLTGIKYKETIEEDRQYIATPSYININNEKRIDGIKIDVIPKTRVEIDI